MLTPGFFPLFRKEYPFQFKNLNQVSGDLQIVFLPFNAEGQNVFLCGC
jgi:hypothetical protein